MIRNKLKIKLIRPPGVMSFPGDSRLPYGMGVTTAALRENGYVVYQDDLFEKCKSFNRNQKLFLNQRIDLDILSKTKNIVSCLNNGISNPKLDRLADRVLSLTPYKNFDIIGFSLHSYSEFLFALLLAEKIKKNINVPIVYGGPFVTLQANLFFERYRFIDYMIVGDGKIPFLRLLDFLDGSVRIEDVPSLFYRKDGEVKVNSREFFDIEDIPLPDFQGLPLELYRRDELGKKMVLPYQISRGCKGKCSFCTFRLTDRIAIKSTTKVIKEIKEYSGRYESKYFSFCDITINSFYNNLKEICELLIQEKVNIKWEAFATVENLDEDLLNKMRQSGCCLLKFGIESGSNKLLQSMRKNSTREEASRILKISHGLGIWNSVYLIVGYPHEAQEDIDQTIGFLKGNERYIHLFQPYRFHLDYNSCIYNRPKEFGIENLGLLKDGKSFAFDEIGGVKWKDKQKQQVEALFEILKAIYLDILSKIYPFGFITFSFYLWYQKLKYRIPLLALFLKYFIILPQKIIKIIYPRSINCFEEGALIMAKDLFCDQRLKQIRRPWPWFKEYE